MPGAVASSSAAGGRPWGSSEGPVPWEVAAGAGHSAAVSSQGEVVTWGDGRCGQLGHGRMTGRHMHPRCNPVMLTTRWWQGTVSRG